MKNLLIIGARGWGREVYNLLPDCIGYQTQFDVKGFLDDKTDALDGMPGYPPIIDSVEHYEPDTNDVFICALGDVKWKKYYSEMVLQKGGEFINLIHSTAKISRNTKIGFGCIITENVLISCEITIGNCVTFQAFATLGHDVRIGDYCHLGCRSFMGGYSELGNMTTIQTGSIILPHVKVGDNCTVGAGSVVIRKVKEGNTVFGNPAKRLDI